MVYNFGMDELEIDGKKYLSSRRAAKEHKYHIDYIGQLIRAGKVTGKKVGRSWYVEASSLKSYLAQEVGGGSQQTPEKTTKTVAKEAFAVPEPEIVIETPAPVVIHAPAIEKIVEPQIVSKPVEVEVPRKVYFSTPEAEPAQKPTLQYVADDEPMLPVLNGRMRANADFIVPMRRMQEEEAISDKSGELEENYAEEVEEEFIEERSRMRMPSTKMIIAGAGILLVVAAISSAILTTSIKVEEGQPASVGIGIK